MGRGDPSTVAVPGPSAEHTGETFLSAQAPLNRYNSRKEEKR
jgi:hypothetical protein